MMCDSIGWILYRYIHHFIYFSDLQLTDFFPTDTFRKNRFARNGIIRDMAAPKMIIQSVVILHLWMVHVTTVGLPVMILNIPVVKNVQQYHTEQQLLPQQPLPQQLKHHLHHQDHNFASNAKVNLENGKSVTMSELKIGDLVQTGICEYLNIFTAKKHYGGGAVNEN